MKWRIEGANEETGDEVTIVIDTPSRAAAEAEARRRGVLVAAITPVDDLTLLSDAAAARRTHATAAVLSYPSLDLPARFAPPTYRGLQVAGSILRIVAGLYYLGAALLILAVIFVLIFGSPAQIFYTPPRTAIAIQLFGVATGLFAIGGICHGFSAGCGALRDIAINSFQRKS